MKKAVLKLHVHDDKDTRKVMKIVSGFAGVKSIEINLKDQKLTVAGDVDPVELAGKLRKEFSTEIISVGPAKDAQKKDGDKKDDQDEKKDGDEGGKADPAKSQKAVLKLNVRGDKDTRKVTKIVSGFAGVDSIDMNLKDQKLTVAGDVDPVELVRKLRKVFITDIISVGPAKDAQKKDGDKKDDQDQKKDGDKGGKSQKAVLKLDVHDDKKKTKAMKIVSGFAGVELIDMDLKDQKLTVAGAVDLVELVGKLRKVFITNIISVSVGPARARPPPLYNYGRYSYV